MNPWVRGDGIGYYAFARAPLIEHSLDFERDYRSGNASFRDARFDENGQPRSFLVTSTGHLDNHFTVGPAILWAPFLLVAHAGVLLARAFGSHVAADGFSAPYRFAMAFGTALYGFLGLLLAARVAREYVDERWAFLATIAIWWSSSLPVYMYFNPSWSHAHSAFAVALFLWYWHETRNQRTLRQWCILAVDRRLDAQRVLRQCHDSGRARRRSHPAISHSATSLTRRAALTAPQERRDSSFGSPSVAQLLVNHSALLSHRCCLFAAYFYFALCDLRECAGDRGMFRSATGLGGRRIFCRCCFPPITDCWFGLRS